MELVLIIKQLQEKEYCFTKHYVSISIVGPLYIPYD